MFISYAPRHGAAETAVIETMKATRFNFGGWQRSYWDLYYGYGLLAAFSVLLEVIVFWQLARLATRDPALGRALILTFAGANLVHAGLCLRYFFLMPIFPDLLVAGCLGAAWYRSGQSVVLENA